jgi:LPS-assembly protein
MKNKIILTLIFLVFFFKLNSLEANEEFIFDVTEIEVTDEGNFFKGLKRGTAVTNSGQTTIVADIFEYDRITKILNAKGNVEIVDKTNDFLLKSNFITYYKNEEKIFSQGITEATIQSTYEVQSKDITLYRKSNLLKSNEKTFIFDDKFTKYETDILNYEINENIFKGSNIKVFTNINKKEYEKEFYYFKDGIFNLKDKDFVASDTKIYVKKNIFNENKNDPRIFGNSSIKKNKITEINKAIFTSCKLTDGCPPWSIKAKKITHNEEKRDIIYNNPILRVYDFPVFYFPKFTHPDPTVRRRSGFLQPQFNDSNILGSSLLVPYFHVLSDDKDITFKPTIFDSEIYMFQSEYRQKNESSNFVADFGLTKGYQSKVNGITVENRNNIGHIFSKFTSELGLDNFIASDLSISIQKITKDTFLKVFETNLIDMNKNVKPASQNQMHSEINLRLENENSYLNSGFIAYENLSGKKSDRFQYVLPYYDYSNQLYKNSLLNLNFSSSGNNNIYETNKLKSIISNNINLDSINFFSKFGFKNNFGVYIKNLNSVGKNSDKYKSSPQIEIMNLINLETSLPLIKIEDDYANLITPKLSFRINPSDMKNYTNSIRNLNTNNIFDINRLGISDSFEQGKSLTLGIDYKKETLENINRFFELKLAGVLRDTQQKNIPISSSINQKTSNLFGAARYNFSEKVNLNYNFSLDNDFNTFEENSVGFGLNLRNFSNTLTFTENSGKLGDTNVWENSTSLQFNKDNFLTFKTRRNRKINLTEYYNLIYEYKNDCLVAGIKYNKTYYKDRDLKPKEDLLLSITFFPLSQYEQKIDDSLYRN